MNIRMMARVAAAAATVGAGSIAGAQAVNFQGSVQGCFFTTTICSGSNSSTIGNLVYSGSTFNATSNGADGLFALGAAGIPGANVNNLGSLTLTDGGFNYTGQKLALFLRFTAPSVQGPATYTSTLTGNLTTTPGGNLFIDFDNTPQIFNFGNGTTLSFGVDDQSIQDNGATSIVSLSGHGFATQQTTTPEPSSLALLATGIVGLVPVFRRRK